jgi:chromosome segregation ATPase
MITRIMGKLGFVRKTKFNNMKKLYEDRTEKMRDELFFLEDKNALLKKEISELKNKIKKLEMEYDSYDLRISLANNNLIKKDNEIKKLKEQVKWLNYENNYYRNRSKYIALNNNIAFGLSDDLLEVIYISENNIKGDEQ